jgi:hypothetical protein
MTFGTYSPKLGFGTSKHTVKDVRKQRPSPSPVLSPYLPVGPAAATEAPQQGLTRSRVDRRSLSCV